METPQIYGHANNALSKFTFNRCNQKLQSPPHSLVRNRTFVFSAIKHHYLFNGPLNQPPPPSVHFSSITHYVFIQSLIMYSSNHSLCIHPITHYVFIQSLIMYSSNHSLCIHPITHCVFIQSLIMYSSNHSLCIHPITHCVFIQSLLRALLHAALYSILHRTTRSSIFKHPSKKLANPITLSVQFL